MLGRLGLLVRVGWLLVRDAGRAGPRELVALTLRWLGRWLGRGLGRGLSLLAALLLLFAEWGWRPLAALLGQLARLRPIARLEERIARLPPYGALVAFLLPTALLLPLKLIALYLLAHGLKAQALGVLIGAKVAGTAVIARLFMLTEPQLMRIGWFARAYHKIMPWKQALFARIRASWGWRYGRMLKSRIQQAARRGWTHARPGLAQVLLQLKVRSRLLLNTLLRRA